MSRTIFVGLIIIFTLYDRAHPFRSANLSARPVTCRRPLLPEKASRSLISNNVPLWSSTSPFDADDAEFEVPNQKEAGFISPNKQVKVGILFALWYVLSIGYNICSKKALNLAPNLAWTAAWFQMALGTLYVGPLWLSGLRARPKLTIDEVTRLLPVAMLHCLVHVGGVISMGAGAVSFTYIVKASEPAVSAALSAIATKTFLPLPVYLTLIPVMGGVALSSVSELTFSWKSFNYAMMSNVASASRGIVGKETMNKRLGKNMNAMNTYAVLTLLSSAMLLPVALFLEGPQILSTFGDLRRAGKFPEYIAQTLMAALFYFTYNECAFVCLDNVSPVSHALGNTLKRVFIIVASIIVFGNKMTTQGIVGSVMAVAGVLLYSLAKTKYKKK